MRRFDFSDEASGWGSSLLFEESMQCWLSRFPVSFFENLRVRTNGYHYTPLHFHTSLPLVVHVTELIMRVSMAESTHCRALVFIHFRGDSSSFSFFSYFCYLISLASSSKSPLQSCCPWLSNSSVVSSAVTSSNPTYCACQLNLSTL